MPEHKETLDSCISVFESTYDTWRRGPRLNPMVVVTNNTIVGNVVGVDLPQHVTHRRQNATRLLKHDVKIINKSPVKEEKAMIHRHLIEHSSSVFALIKEYGTITFTSRPTETN